MRNQKVEVVSTIIIALGIVMLFVGGVSLIYYGVKDRTEISPVVQPVEEIAKPTPEDEKIIVPRPEPEDTPEPDVTIMEVVPGISTSTIENIAEDYDDERQKIVDSINAERLRLNLLPITRNEKLDAAAKAKAKAMIEQGFYAHNDPDGSTPWHYIKEAGYPYLMAGENLSFAYDVDGAIEAWFDSHTHYLNIIKPYYIETGIWIEGPYIVQFFGMKL